MLSTILSEHGPSFACLSVQCRIRSKRQEREGLSNQEGVSPVAQVPVTHLPFAASPCPVEGFACMLWGDKRASAC